jgi:hypothetical protein
MHRIQIEKQKQKKARKIISAAWDRDNRAAKSVEFPVVRSGQDIRMAQ